MFAQKTLRNPISCSGIGLHSGNRISMTINPADANTGIVFKRVDIQGQGKVIPAHVSHITDTQLCSCIGDGNGVKISTIEHLMAAFHALGVDNAEVEINGSEVPAMDGSASAFVFLIECAGLVEQDSPKQVIRILKKISLSDERASVSLSPSANNKLNIDFEINFKDKVVGKQNLGFKLSSKNFKKEIAKARTFGYAKEVEKLRSIGLAKGGSLENAVVIDDDSIMNEDGLRYSNEFVRHKVLDAVGDLYLSGYTVIGNFQGFCSGHAHTYKLLQKLLEDKSAYEVVCLENIKTAKDQKTFNVNEEMLASA